MHGAPGISIISISYPDGTGPISAVTYVGDGVSKVFNADIVTTTGTANVSMMGYLDTVMTPKEGAKTRSAQVSGYSGEHLYIQLKTH